MLLGLPHAQITSVHMVENTGARSVLLSMGKLSWAHTSNALHYMWPVALKANLDQIFITGI